MNKKISFIFLTIFMLLVFPVSIFADNSKMLKDTILSEEIIEAVPNVHSSFDSNHERSGLYSSNDTTNNNYTYYYRGNVNNNYITFANNNWRIVRLNEDGSIKILLDDVIFYSGNHNQMYNTYTSANYDYMYFSNSNAKNVLEHWYDESNVDNYDSYIKRYSFCESMKIDNIPSTINSWEDDVAPIFNEYQPSFKCNQDINGYSIVNSKVGLLTLDEVMFFGAGRTPSNPSKLFFDNDTYYNWIMTPAGIHNNHPLMYTLNPTSGDGITPGIIGLYAVSGNNVALTPVINLNDNTLVRGTGTADDPYSVLKPYIISLRDDGNGRVNIPRAYYAQGDVVEVEVIPNEGYELDKITIEIDGVVSDLEGTSFTVTKNAIIGGVFKPSTPKINDFNIIGINKPIEGKSPITSGIEVTSSGVNVSQVEWVDEKDERVLNETDKFELNKKYILRITFNKEDGYEFSSYFGDDSILANVDFLKSEFVEDSLEVRLYFEIVEKPKITVAPKVKVSNSNNNSLLISWNQDDSVSKYEVYRSENKKKWTKVGTVTTNSYTNGGLTYGKTYYYKVKAINNVSNKTSSIVSGKTIPNKMVLKTYGEGSNNIKVSWDKVAVNGYEIYRSSDGKKWTKIKTITKNSTLAFNNTKLSPNKKYYYKARAYKIVGKKKIYGPWSAVVSTKTTVVIPALTLSMRNLEEINIKIGTSKGAVNYVVEKSTDGTTYSLLEELPGPGVLANGPVVIGNKYYYRVKACTAEKCSGWVTKSIVASTLTPNLTLKTSSKKITVTVKSVEGADGYEVYRVAKKKNGKYVLVKTLLTENGVYTFNNGSKKGVTYYYKVRAYKLVDDKKVYSPFSGIKSIKSK